MEYDGNTGGGIAPPGVQGIEHRGAGQVRAQHCGKPRPAEVKDVVVFDQGALGISRVTVVAVGRRNDTVPLPSPQGVLEVPA